MRCNVGGLDRALRFILGTVFFLTALLAPIATAWRAALFALAALALLTALVAYCPLNRLLGVNTCTKTLP